MNMKRLTSALVLAVGFFCVEVAVAQDEEIKKPSLVQTSPYTKSITQERTSLPYHAVQEADIMWSKKVWRVIDLREKINFPLYYPTQRMRNRHSLIQVLVDSIKHGAIRAYTTDNSDFVDTLSFKEIAKRFEAVDTVEKRPSLEDASVLVDVPVKGVWRWSEVKQIEVLEEWFFDRRRSVLDVRIIGLCPIRVFHKMLKTGGEEQDEEADDSELNRTQLFWVYYPDIRNVLTRTMAFNARNQGQEYSFDDIFLKRKFSSYIVKEANVQNDRRINSYTIGGIPNMLESQRVYDEIMSQEQDMWEY